MQDPSVLKIIGIDSKRPPMLRKEPYIDIVFELSEQTSKQWCDDFCELFQNSDIKPKIDSSVGLYIETWTRKMHEIPEHLEVLKAKIIECNQIAIDRQAALDALALNNSNVEVGNEGPQGQLNAVIANLNFD